MNEMNIVDTFNTGGLIAYPTEAVFGLGCDPDNEKAIKTLVSVIDNSILFEILNQIRVGTPLQNIVLIDDEISFSNKIKKVSLKLK